MSFIFEQKEPFLCFSFNVYIHLDSACIDFLRFIQLVKHTLRLQVLCSQGSNVHQIDRFGPSQLFSCSDVILVSALYLRIIESDAVYCRVERGVSAVIRPVCIYHLYLCYGWISVFGSEIFLTEFQIRYIHGQSVLRYEL